MFEETVRRLKQPTRAIQKYKIIKKTMREGSCVQSTTSVSLTVPRMKQNRTKITEYITKPVRGTLYMPTHIVLC